MEENSNLENFIKGRLANGQYSYQESDWLALENRLDRAGMLAVRSPYQNIKTILFLLLLLTVAFFSGYLLKGYYTQQEPSLTTEKSVSRNFNDQSKPSNIQPKIIDEHRESPDINSKTTVDKRDLVKNGDDGFIGNEHVVDDEISPANDELIAILDSKSFEQDYSELVLAAAEGRSESISKPLFTSYLKKVQLPEFGLANEDRKENIFDRNKFSFGFSFSSDFNSVGLNKNGSFTLRPGLQLYYDINSKWSASTGIFYNKKRYETIAKDYTPPTGYWLRRTQGVVPNVIHGSCRVVDVPFLVYYKWKDGEQFFLSSGFGLNNYILLDEDYNWTFEDPNPGAADGWSTDKNSKVYAGLLNISVAMGIKISKRKQLIIEPYFKKPIKDIGWGKVKMYSAGAQFTMKLL